jgi:hypothetical protein
VEGGRDRELAGLAELDMDRRQSLSRRSLGSGRGHRERSARRGGEKDSAIRFHEVSLRID